MGFASQLHNLGLSDEELDLTEQSRVAYLNEMLAKEERSEIIVDENIKNDLENNREVINIDEAEIQRNYAA